MITIGLDFGTHQTKVCFETIEAGMTFYDVFRFAAGNQWALTIPSFVRHCADGTLRYGHEAVSGEMTGRAITYFKQIMFSWLATEADRKDAEQWSVLFLAYVIFKLDERLGRRCVFHIGMPTDADPQHHDFSKRQAIKVMASALLLSRSVFRGDLNAFLRTHHVQLLDLVVKCMRSIPYDIREAQRRFPVLVFPEAYAVLIPLIKDYKLPEVGPNLFVDIGGGTVDISFFTNQMDRSIGENRPCLYYYHSIPYGLNAILGQDIRRCHSVNARQTQMTGDGVCRFRENLTRAIDDMMIKLRREYERLGRTSVMPFDNLCSQMLDGRPICYSGGGSVFRELRLQISQRNSANYNFSDLKTVSALIDHSKLDVSDEEFHILATAFALSHQSLVCRENREVPDQIKLVSIGRLFDGVRLPQMTFPQPAKDGQSAGSKYFEQKWVDAKQRFILESWQKAVLVERGEAQGDGR